MAGFDSVIGITLKAIDGASGVVEGAAKNIEAAQNGAAASSASMAARVGSSFDRVGASAMSAGKSLTRGLTLPSVAIMGVSAKMAYDFQNQMELIRTSAGIPQDQIAGLSNKVLALAGQVGQAPEKLAQGFYHIASAGNGIWSTSQMLDILKVAAEGANLGMADMDSTTYALSSTMASGIGGIKSASDAMAVLNAIVGAGDMRMEDLNAAIGTGVLSTMKVAGVDIRSFGAALATLADNGEHADEAATRLRMSVALMSSPSGAASKQLKALGLTAEDASKATSEMNEVFAKSGLTTTKLADDLRKPDGITVAMEDLQKHLEDAGLSVSETDAMLAKAFGGGRTDAAILTMLTNIDRMREKYDAVGQSAGDFQNKLEDLNQTNNQKLRDAWAGLQADFIRLGEDVLPEVVTVMKQVGGVVHDLAGMFEGMSPAQRQVIVDMALMAAATGPLLIGFGAVARGIGSIITVGSKLGLVARGLAGAEGVAGAAEAATGAIAGGEGLTAAAAGLAAVLTGPVGIALLGTAVAAGVGYLAWKRLGQATHEYGAETHGVYGAVTFLTLAQQRHKTAVDGVTKAHQALKGAQQSVKTGMEQNKKAADNVATAQRKVNDALNKYGEKSPQYQKAVHDLNKRQDDLNLAMLREWSNSVSVQSAEDRLKNKRRELGQATGALKDLQARLNAGLESGVTIIKRFGPAAAAQVGAISNLQLHISSVVKAFNGISIAAAKQTTIAGRYLQGLGSTISSLQSQSGSLNRSLQSASGSLQAVSGSGLQGTRATGGRVHAGLSYVINEKGQEVFTPDRDGYVSSASDSKKMGGDTYITISGNISIATPEAATSFWDRIDKTQRLARLGVAA